MTSTLTAYSVFLALSLIFVWGCFKLSRWVKNSPNMGRFYGYTAIWLFICLNYGFIGFAKRLLFPQIDTLNQLIATNSYMSKSAFVFLIIIACLGPNHKLVQNKQD